MINIIEPGVISIDDYKMMLSGSSVETTGDKSAIVGLLMLLEYFSERIDSEITDLKAQIDKGAHCGDAGIHSFQFTIVKIKKAKKS